MRVISQNGMIDIPYEKFVFAISNDGCIVAVRDSVGRSSEIARGIIAKYSSIEKAKKAMRLLHEAYTGMPIIFRNTEIEDGYLQKFKEAMKSCILTETPSEPPKVEYINRAIFQFPKEEDL